MQEKTKILGGPGCGKTYNLMKKYKSLLQEGVTPEDITLITFRKSSAEDLIRAVSNNINSPESVIRKHVGTIHSISLRLQNYPGVLDLKDRTTFLSKYKYLPYVKQTSIKLDEEDSAFSGDLFDLYTWIKNTHTPFDKWYLYPGFNNIQLPKERVSEFLNNYEKFKAENNKIDYSDMLQKVIDNKIDLDTPVLMVDEFQDLTAQMYQLFKMWEVNREVVVIAGDPYQSIYGFWGGSPDYYNNYAARELILDETHRLPEQIKNFGRKILKYGGMIAPDTKAKVGYEKPICKISYDTNLPTYNTELHLIRCNYQADALAMTLAEQGKVFGGLQRVAWTVPEVELANAIIEYRSGVPLKKPAMTAIIKAYPSKFFGKGVTTESLLKNVDNNFTYTPRTTALTGSTGIITPRIHDSLLSRNPVAEMNFKGKLLTAKIKGILDRKFPIMFWEINNRKIMTIHGSKGLEADTVFLHSSITPRIWKNTVLPGEEYSAEARVWYVAATRAKEKLFLIEDKGRNWSFPEVAAC